jgi:hypothetical protein
VIAVAEKVEASRFLGNAILSTNKFSPVVIKGLIRSGSGELKKESTAPGLPTCSYRLISLGDKGRLDTLGWQTSTISFCSRSTTRNSTNKKISLREKIVDPQYKKKNKTIMKEIITSTHLEKLV